MKCPTCKWVCGSQVELVKHMNIHSVIESNANKAKILHNCNFCDFSSNALGVAIVHLKRHDGYTFEEVFKPQQKNNVELQQIDNSVTETVNNADQSEAVPKFTVNTAEQSKPPPKCFICLQCDLAFSEEDELLQHLHEHLKSLALVKFSKQIVDGATVQHFHCGLCDYNIDSLANVIIHLKDHSELEPFFSNMLKQSKEKHINIPGKSTDNIAIKRNDIVEKELHCGICDFNSDKFGVIINHLKEHTSNLAELVNQIEDREEPSPSDLSKSNSSEVDVKEQIENQEKELPPAETYNYNCSLCTFGSDQIAKIVIHLKCHPEVQDYLEKVYENMENQKEFEETLPLVNNTEKSAFENINQTANVIEVQEIDKDVENNYWEDDFVTTETDETVREAESRTAAEESCTDLIKQYQFKKRFNKPLAVENDKIQFRNYSNHFNIFDQMLCKIVKNDKTLTDKDKKCYKFVGIVEKIETHGLENKNAVNSFWKILLDNHRNKLSQQSNEKVIKELDSIFRSGQTVTEIFTYDQKSEKENLFIPINQTINKKKKNYKSKIIKACLTSGKKQLYKCLECDFSAPKKIKLIKHNRLIHPKQKGVRRKIDKEQQIFNCPHCEYTSRKSFRIKSHVLCRHSDFYPYICEICGVKFKLKNPFIVHKMIHTGEKPYSCNLCPVKFRHSTNLKRHLRVHTGEKPYCCSQCDYKTSQSNSLKMHQKIHQKRYACTVCTNVEFNEYFEFVKHRKTHRKRNLYSCKSCDFSTDEAEDWKMHKISHKTITINGEIVHSTIRKRKKKLSADDYINSQCLSCSNCDFTTEYSSTMKKHMKRHEVGNISLHTCVTCGFTSKQKGTFKTHVKSHGHKLCRQCNYQAENVSLLMYHIKTTHPKVKSVDNNEINPTDTIGNNNQMTEILPIIEELLPVDNQNYVTEPDIILSSEDNYCSYNNMQPLEINVLSQENVNGVQLDVSTQENNDSYLCDECGVPFETAQSLKRHKLKHNNPNFKQNDPKKRDIKIGRIFKCKECVFTSSKKESLQIHISDYHMEDKPLKCDLCPFRTKKLVYLKGHYKSHLRSEIICSECGYKCVQPKDYHRHMHRYHTTIKPFKCDQCGMTYKNKKNLIIHKNKNSCFKKREKKEVTYFCPLCTYQSKIRQDVTNHRKLQHTKIQDVLECSLCDFKTTSASVMNKHNGKHIRQHKFKTFKCLNCPFVSKSFRTLERHYFEVHKNNEPLQPASTDEQIQLEPSETDEKISSNPEQTSVNLEKSKISAKMKSKRENELIKKLQEYVEIQEKVAKKFRCSDCKFACVEESQFKLHIFSHFIKTHNPSSL